MCLIVLFVSLKLRSVSIKGAMSRYFELCFESLKIVVNWKEINIEIIICRADKYQRSKNKSNGTRMVKDAED